jgi:hypothetical protein
MISKIHFRDTRAARESQRGRFLRLPPTPPKQGAYQSQNSVSDYNPLDLIEAELIAPAIVELRGARAELPDLLTSKAAL